jgi:hypothetical protein
MMSSRPVIFSVPFVFVAQMAWAIGSCPDYPLPNPTQAIEQYLSRNGNSCVLGSYLKLNASYNADFATGITGGCERYLGTPPSCPYYDTQYRYIGATSIWETGASGLLTVYPKPDWPAPSALDTRQFDTSTPDTPQWQFNNEGERELISGSNISLNCGSPVTYVQVAKTYNVVKCMPWFWNDNAHLDPAEIYIFLPSNSPYSAGLDAAIADWNSKLAGAGVHLNRRTTSCSAGPHCVNVLIDDSIPKCGWADSGGINASGVAQNPWIKINSLYNFTVTGLQRTFAHEIGHLLGLNNNLSCNKDDSTMVDSFHCDQTEVANVQTSDWLPVTKSVYGGGTKSVCGW